jgi:hypothetical protein
MATTTNFGWETPDDTDLVKDGAAAMRTLGGAIDTSLVDLKGGTTGQILSKATATDMDFTWITNDVGDITAVTAGTGISGGGTSGAVTVTNSMATAIDAKGDLVPGTGADTFARLAVGANNTVLIADSTTATGLKWGSVSITDNFSLLNAGGTAMSGLSTVTISGISGKNQLYIIVKTTRSNSSGDLINLRLNGDSTSGNYQYTSAGVLVGSTSVVNSILSDSMGAGVTSINLGQTATATDSSFTTGVSIAGTNSAGYKMVTSTSSSTLGTGGNAKVIQTTGWYSGTSTISSISIIANSGSFTQGTVYVYGA